MNNVSPLEALKGGFRKACVKRLVGDEQGAVEVLTNEIPMLVVAWSKVTSIAPAEKKAKLKELFDDESTRAEELAIAFDLFSARFEVRVAEQVENTMHSAINRINSLTDRVDTLISSLSGIDFQNANSNSGVPSELNETEIEVLNESKIENDNLAEDSNNKANLDPPMSTGLVFDDIEGMIDELLSSEK